MYFFREFILFREGIVKVYCGKSFSCLVYKNPGDQFTANLLYENLFLKMMEILQPFQFHFIKPAGKLRRHETVFVEHGISCW